VSKDLAMVAKVDFKQFMITLGPKQFG